MNHIPHLDFSCLVPLHKIPYSITIHILSVSICHQNGDWLNSTLKFHAVAEKTADNVRGLLSSPTWRRVASTAVDSVQPATSDTRIALWVDWQNARRERQRESIAHDTVTFVVAHLSPYTRIKSNHIIFINIQQQIKSTQVKKEKKQNEQYKDIKGRCRSWMTLTPPHTSSTTQKLRNNLLNVTLHDWHQTTLSNQFHALTFRLFSNDRHTSISKKFRPLLFLSSVFNRTPMRANCLLLELKVSHSHQ